MKSGLETFRQHLDLANERFELAEEQMKQEKYHTAAHLFINSAINYHNAVCQKFLNRIPSHKQHSDTSYFPELAKFLKKDLPKYCDAYKSLVSQKSRADYGTDFSSASAEQIRRRAQKIKEIAEQLL